MPHAAVREDTSAALAIEAMFKAGSVALVGASSDPGKFGYMTLDSLIKGGFGGPIYPVNPKADELIGLKAYPSLSDIPGPIDLALVIVPARFVAGIIREAAAKGAKGALILSAGFRESGRPDLEAEILEAARETGLRLMGPNMQGVNYLPNRLCAMFFPVITTRGPLAVISQSGSVTAALSEWAERDELGITAAVNLGNQVDLCEANYLDFFAHDDETRAIVMYIEGLQDGRRFMAALARATAVKPVCVLKGGRTVTGVKSASSHTGSLAGRPRIFTAACRQSGALVADDLETLYDYVKGAAVIKPPEGNRLAIVSTSGGAATLASDEADTVGFTVPPLSPALVEDLKRCELSPLAHLTNPLDLGSIEAGHFDQVIRLIDRHDAADVILISFADPVAGGVEMIRELAPSLETGLAVSYMGGGEEELRGRLELARAGFAAYPSPERAVRGIRAAMDYSRIRKQGGRETL